MTLLLAPAGVPGEIMGKLNAAFQQALEAPDVAAKLRAMGQAVMGGSSEEAAQALRPEAQQWEKLIKERNIQLGRSGSAASQDQTVGELSAGRKGARLCPGARVR